MSNYQNEKKIMKKMFLALAATVMMSTAAVAQDKQECKQHKKLDKTEMAKHRTERMAQKYGLDATQQQKLQALNEKYADKLARPGHHGPHGGPRPDSLRGQRPAPPKDGQRPPRDGQRPPKDMNGNVGETMKAYDAELQQIMTADQFTAYKADTKKRFAKGGHRGPRFAKKADRQTEE